MKVPDLKELLKKKNLKSTGNKKELIERLLDVNGYFGNLTDEGKRQHYMKMKVTELKEMCRKQGFKVSGSKGELVDMLLHPNRKTNISKGPFGRGGGLVLGFWGDDDSM